MRNTRMGKPMRNMMRRETTNRTNKYLHLWFIPVYHAYAHFYTHTCICKNNTRKLLVLYAHIRAILHTYVCFLRIALTPQSPHTCGSYIHACVDLYRTLVDTHVPDTGRYFTRMRVLFPSTKAYWFVITTRIRVIQSHMCVGKLYTHACNLAHYTHACTQTIVYFDTHA